MKFTARLPKENVNVSKIHPLSELFVLLSGILGVLLLIYLVLGLALDIVVDRMPLKFEQTLVGFFGKAFRFEESPTDAEQKMQRILDELVAYLPGSTFDLVVHIDDSPQVNAVALPGGHIIIYAGLLKEIESENELAMILSHEVGHFIHRDHLRGLGRGVVLVFISSVFLGVDNSVTGILQKMLITVNLKHSRQQEIAADNFAIDLIYKKYGHVAGAADFFQRMKDKREMPSFFKFFSTHPLDKERINLLQAKIETAGYVVGDKRPLAPVYEGYRKSQQPQPVE